MSKKLLRRVIPFILLAGSAVARVAFAQPPNGNGGVLTLPNPLNLNSLTDVLNKIINNFLIPVAIPLAAIMALIGGFQMMTAGGDPEKFSNGRKTLMYAAIGFAVVLLASGISFIVKDLLGA